jgi:hypothetical protein
MVVLENSRQVGVRVISNRVTLGLVLATST